MLKESTMIHMYSPVLFLLSHLLSSRCQVSVKANFSFDYFHIVYSICQKILLVLQQIFPPKQLVLTCIHQKAKQKTELLYLCVHTRV